MSKAISRRDFLKVTGAVGAAESAGCLRPRGSAASAPLLLQPGCFRSWPEQRSVTLTAGWWGGGSRHNPFPGSLKAFC